MHEVNRFEDVLPGLFTRVRMTQTRVRIDAPDWEAFLIAFAALFYTQGLVLLPLVLVSVWSLKVGVALALLGLVTTRVHATVSCGEARIVRSVFFVPWSDCVTRSHEDVCISDSKISVAFDDWGGPVVLWLGKAHQEEVRFIHARCQRLLA